MESDKRYFIEGLFIIVISVAAAFFDATGIEARRIPLTPAYVTKLLSKVTPKAV